MGEGGLQSRVAALRAATGARPTYTAAGVDVDAGDRAVELMRALVTATHGPDVLGGFGGFASAVSLPAGLRDPVLVSATDGVGTKTAIAAALGRYDTIGRDLVAMCADDVVCLGARPWFFLDYLAVGRVVPVEVAALVGGVAHGCMLAGCALVGGETAEHPGILEPNEFDMAGFCVGVAERSDLLDGSAATAGDVLLGIASSGLHSNGFSLVRALLAEHGLELGRPYVEVVSEVMGSGEVERLTRREPHRPLDTLGDVLLTPTEIYALHVVALRAELDAAGTPLRAVAHITGGGLPGNIPRVLPHELAARVTLGSWPVPSIFRVIATLGGLDGPEMRATLNAGLGMVVVVPEAAVERAIAFLAGRGLAAWPVGTVVSLGAADGARYRETGTDDATE